MKTRSGFVSNSSSSSFVVRRFDDMFSATKRLKITKEQDKLLKENGFTLQLCYYPHQVDVRTKLRKRDLADANWGKSVICNQDYEIEFLLQNRISFMADIHYEHYTMIYDGQSDVLLIAQNYGKQAQMNGNDKVNFKPWRKPGVKRTTGKTYLKHHRL